MKITRENLHRYIKCFDNGGKTADRYSVAYLNEKEHKVGRMWLYGGRSMSEHPCHPQGVGCYTTMVTGNHLGKKIRFEELPIDCQKLVLSDLEVK